MTANKTIAKNTLFLYFRMILVMGVSLYTSRIVLRELGVSDYGIYGLVGSVVILISFFNGAMASATQRYLAFDIGNGTKEQLTKTFSATLTIHFGIACLLIIIAETVGLWYINKMLIFPKDRVFAVNVVYQFSIATAVVGIIQVPYNALMMAREHMNVYAYVSVLEALLKLMIIFLLTYLNKDKLITYAILLFLVSLIIRSVYFFYCKKHFIESKYELKYDKNYYKELISYSGWNMFGNIAVVARGQGVNIVLNLFFGTSINAAYALTTQVQGVAQMLVLNFQVAVNPQIIKQYAQGNIDQTQNLIFNSSKFSYYLLLLVLAPLCFNINFILNKWLIIIPEYSAILIQLSLVAILIDSISGPLMTGIQATGRIKIYQIVVGTLLFLNLPMTYFFLKFSILKTPLIAFYIWISISIISLFCRLYFINKVLRFDTKRFMLKVVLNLFITTIVISLFGILIDTYLIGQSNVIIALRILSLTIASLAVIYISLEKKEKYFVKLLINKIKK